MTDKHPEAIKIFPNSTRILIRKLHNRIFNKNKNALVVVVGETGSGKSYSVIGLMIGLYLYRHGKMPTDEYIVDHCKFRALDFMKAMNTKELQRGEAWLWDEAGIDAGSKEHATNKNKILSWYAQTCRNQHQIIFFTLPTLSMLDSNIRKMIHFYLESCGIDMKRKMSIIKPLRMQYNTRMDKIYYHKVAIPSLDGGMNVITLAGIPKMSDSLMKLYEEKKSKFTDNLNDEITTILQMLENKRTRSAYVQFTELQESIYYLYHKLKSERGIEPRQNEIARRLNMALSSVAGAYRGMNLKSQTWKLNGNLLPPKADVKLVEEYIPPAKPTNLTLSSPQ